MTDDLNVRLQRIEAKLDRVLEFTLAKLPRMVDQWPTYLSTRAKNTIARYELTPGIVRSESLYQLQRRGGLGPGTARELKDAAAEKA